MAEKDTLYARWLEGKISDEEKQRLMASGEWQELEKITNTVDSWAIPEYNVDEAWKMVRGRRSSTLPKRLPVHWLSLAAACMILLLGGLLWWQSGKSTIKAQVTRQILHTFPDQSTCHLNAESSLSFRDGNWSSQRNVLLNGEGFFEVASGAPFTVETRLGTIEVLGTSFNVRAREDRLYVTCYTGIVKVSAGKQAREIRAGEEVRLIGSDLNLKDSIDAGSPTWLEGSSSFVDEPVQNVFKEMERQFDAHIRSDSKMLFTGSFDHTDLESALKLVCDPLSLSYDTDLVTRTVTITEI